MSTDNIAARPLFDFTDIVEQCRRFDARLREMTAAAPYSFTREAKVDFVGQPVARNKRADALLVQPVLSYWPTPRTFPEMRIIENELLTVPAEDWSRVRSPGRARRRMRQGHRQNVRYYQAPDPKLVYTDDTIIGHPATIRLLFKHEQERAEKLLNVHRSAALRGVKL